MKARIAGKIAAVRRLTLPREHSVPVKAIMRATEHVYGMPIGGLRSSKSPRTCSARQIAMYCMRKLTSYSLPQIGRVFGGFHHTTVLYSIDRVEAAMAEYPEVAELISRICDLARNATQEPV
jgi:chromosomal replication initiator protein